MNEPPHETRVVVVLSTFPDTEIAQGIGRELVDQELVACVNVFPRVCSIYRWEGKTHEDSEVFTLMKTTPEKYPELEKALSEKHPYDTPEILALPVAAGSEKYLQWVASSCPV